MFLTMIAGCNLRVTGRREFAVLKNVFEIVKQYGTEKTSGIDGEKNFCPFAHFFIPQTVMILVI